MKLNTEKLEAIFFHVEKVESASLDEDKTMEYNSDNFYRIVAKWPVTNAKGEGVLRRKTLNFCSDIYSLITNREVLEPLIPVLADKFKHLDMTVSNDKDAQFSVRISPTIASISPGTEVIKPLVTFTNSYDGKVQAQATGGLVRHLVDENGNVQVTYSTFLKDLSFVYKFKHNSEGILDMVNLSAKVDQYIKDFTRVEEQVELFKSYTIKKGEKAMTEFLTLMANGTTFPLKDIEETLERIEYESMVLDCDPNLWTIYNAMNYVTEYTEKSLTKKMRMDVDAKIYANMLEFVESKTKKRAKKSSTETVPV